MSAEPTELEEFRAFFDEELSNGSSCKNIDELVTKFRQLQGLRAKLATSREQSQRGEAKRLDIEEVIVRGTRRAAEKGIME